MQNAYTVFCLLASRGFAYPEEPFPCSTCRGCSAAARGVVFNGIPPYDL